jgi:hypothetical protein
VKIEAKIASPSATRDSFEVAFVCLHVDYPELLYISGLSTYQSMPIDTLLPRNLKELTQAD